jgi:hypothetical protein
MNENSQLQNEVKELKKEMEAQKNLHTTGLVAPSSDNTPRLTRAGNVTSTPPGDGRKRLYTEAGRMECDTS